VQLAPKTTKYSFLSEKSKSKQCWVYLLPCWGTIKKSPSALQKAQLSIDLLAVYLYVIQHFPIYLSVNVTFKFIILNLSSIFLRQQKKLDNYYKLIYVYLKQKSMVELCMGKIKKNVYHVNKLVSTVHKLNSLTDYCKSSLFWPWLFFRDQKLGYREPNPVR
jgi:hypothetical protein